MKNKLYLHIFIIILTLVSLNYFFAIILPSVFKHFRFIIIGCSVLYSLYYIRICRGQNGFETPIQLLIIAMLFSVVISYLTWGQSIHIGLLVLIPFMLFPIFFLLVKIKLKINTLETIIISFSFLYVILYLIQFSNPSNVMFSEGGLGDEGYREVRGIIRVIFPGAGIFWLGSYIALIKVTDKPNKYFSIYILLTLLGLIIPIMQVTRSFVLPTMLVFIYHFSRKLNWSKKLIILTFLLISGYFLSDIIYPAIEGMLNRTESTLEDGESDQRFVTTYFFLNEFPPTFINKIFGNGMGHTMSGYGRYLEHLTTFGFHISDIGAVGVYTYFGVFYLIGWLIIGIKIFFLKIPEKYIYVKYYFFNVLLGCFSGSTLYHINFMISTVFALYIFQKTIIDEKRKKEIISKLKKLLKLDKLKEYEIMSNKNKI